MTTGLDRTYHAHRFFLVLDFIFLFVPCGRLSWLPVSFLLHVKYTLSYRIVSYLIHSLPSERSFQMKTVIDTRQILLEDRSTTFLGTIRAFRRTTGAGSIWKSGACLTAHWSTFWRHFSGPVSCWTSLG